MQAFCWKRSLPGPIWAVLLLMPAAMPPQAAEIRGEVVVDIKPQSNSSRPPAIPISVALSPARGQKVAETPAQEHRLEIRKGRLQPRYVALRVGDRLTVVNRDGMYHEIYTLFPGERFSLHLNKAGKEGAVRSVRMQVPGRRQLFCRMHESVFARVDVVDAPYVKMLQGPGQYHFEGLQPGLWRLRVTTLGSPVRTQTTTAVTAPPPLRVELPVTWPRPETRQQPFAPVDAGTLFPKRRGRSP